MKISQALSKKNDLQKRLGRLIDLRKNNFRVVIKKDETLDEARKSFKDLKIVEFGSISEKINRVVLEITDLRERILRTNVKIEVQVGDDKVSLAKLILLINDAKSELKQLSSLKERSLFDRKRKIAKTDEEEKEVDQLTDLELEELVTALEDKKSELQYLLEEANALTELVS